MEVSKKHVLVLAILAMVAIPIAFYLRYNFRKERVKEGLKQATVCISEGDYRKAAKIVDKLKPEFEGHSTLKSFEILSFSVELGNISLDMSEGILKSSYNLENLEKSFRRIKSDSEEAKKFLANAILEVRTLIKIRGIFEKIRKQDFASASNEIIANLNNDEFRNLRLNRRAMALAMYEVANAVKGTATISSARQFIQSVMNEKDEVFYRELLIRLKQIESNESSG